ncbi:ABC transporter ATP-binding protein [Weissella confusa]|mgnify:FL=1|uniref:ATP-binding cassette domain-containing protein n=1 Tax=Weissella confusa TaxID=1583 RepID=A0A4Z0RPJ8_WEICO|nr:ATP-binding cassette domain-containing protein [Weissella confusa]MBJ7615355.1 ATP-binding cassette domain-containing protein [Weissella confusa]MBJ7625670.1 ATP-binding cassette domain-containing protein [Weissella confusa]MBJ7633142.1 ATP-binding cassette domain-containing protein [Weissella confusa]MBJ7639554.1 ATP-binding cassette domain-containing protein [Weissella confusa]MBJ7645970.1 ATP-binding cassette domain-containing protein [Weissella confusa]
METPILQLSNINKSFGRVRALRDVSFSVARGTIIGLVGPNGAGKSTTMKVITGVTAPDVGEIKVAGETVTMQHRHVLAKVGALIENPGLYAYMTGWDNLKLYAAVAGISDNEITEIVTQLGLVEFINKKVKTYSWGMKQRVGVALAMVNDPDLLLLDEPLNGMDPVSAEAVKVVLRDWRDAGKTILISSHTVRDLEGLVDDYIFIDRGEIISRDEILTAADGKVDPDLEEMFADVIARRKQQGVGDVD